MKSLIGLTKETGRQNVISIGLNMSCKKVITKSVLVYQNGQFYLENGGIKIQCTEQELVNDSETLLDTKENRKILAKIVG